MYVDDMETRKQENQCNFQRMLFWTNVDKGQKKGKQDKPIWVNATAPTVLLLLTVY